MAKIYVDIDPYDVLAEVSTEAMKRELRQRGQEYIEECTEELERAIDCLQRGDVHEAELLIERALRPKFDSFDAALSQYAQAKKRGAANAS